MIPIILAHEVRNFLNKKMQRRFRAYWRLARRIEAQYNNQLPMTFEQESEYRSLYRKLTGRPAI